MKNLIPLFSDTRAIQLLDDILKHNKEIFGFFNDDEDAKFFKERMTRKDNFKYLLHAQSGTMILLYNRTKEVKWDNAHVVWNDSSGEPTGIVAKNLDDFLSLLHFGDGFLSEFLMAAYMNKLMLDTYKNPLTTVTDVKINSIITNTLASDKNFGWLTEKLTESGYPKVENPVEMAWKAFNIEYPVVI
ncbi:hypothetical protein [Pedobacter ginsengisoli]|uniref:hypothetical protein n=1 Tax=Pedobacter ginsengisoli TaxID=363852 RepID=UPI00254A771D|nr:hypothetical protein [Pedobacter ginsengisoli]